MMQTMTRGNESRAATGYLLVAFELSERWWKVGFTTGVAPGTPHISWVLMYGDRDTADREFACQSEPRSDCVLPVSRPDAQVLSDIHLYFHGVGGETKYEGTKNLSYLQGSPESHISRVSVTATKNESITNESVTGIVTSTPGRYTVTLSVTATVSGTGKNVRVVEGVRLESEIGHAHRATPKHIIAQSIQRFAAVKCSSL